MSELSEVTFSKDKDFDDPEPVNLSNKEKTKNLENVLNSPIESEFQSKNEQNSNLKKNETKKWEIPDHVKDKQYIKNLEEKMKIKKSNISLSKDDTKVKMKSKKTDVDDVLYNDDLSDEDKIEKENLISSQNDDIDNLNSDVEIDLNNNNKFNKPINERKFYNKEGEYTGGSINTPNVSGDNPVLEKLLQWLKPIGDFCSQIPGSSGGLFNTAIFQSRNSDDEDEDVFKGNKNYTQFDDV